MKKEEEIIVRDSILPYLILVIFFLSFISYVSLWMTNNIWHKEEEVFLSLDNIWRRKKKREREEHENVCFKMMPIGYYNYVIGGRLNTRDERKSLYSSTSSDFFFSSVRDGTCWDDEKTSRQWLWWIRTQQADAGILPFVVSAWMHLFSLQSVIYFGYLTTYVYINLFKIINISIVYSQLDVREQTKKKTGVGHKKKNLNDVHHLVLDRLHHINHRCTYIHHSIHLNMWSIYVHV